MSLISGSSVTGAGGAAAGEYEISRSLRFNSADSAYLNRTPAGAGSVTTWTFSAWVKRSNLDASNALFGVSNNSDKIWFSSDQLSFYIGAGAAYTWWSAALFRDPSAWYHIIVVLDTTNATESSRVRVYINGVLATPNAGSTSYPTLNYAGCNFNTAVAHHIGRADTSNNFYFNGYLTEINFIDGSALDPTSFGEFNSDTGVWQPIEYTGTYGTNGFYLNFSDNASTTTLGDDLSGNNNDWTTNNFSVTAGAGNDSLVDSPTRYGTDTGAGGEVRGNYCTLNPLDTSGNTLSNGNLDAVSTGAGGISKGTFAVSSGKWYWEVRKNANNTSIGIALSTVAPTTAYVGDGQTWSYYSVNGQLYTNGSGVSYGATYADGDVIGIALDLDNDTLTFYKNGASQGTAVTGLTGTYTPAVGNDQNGPSVSANFGQRPFAHTAPSGFKALVTTNLPTPTIEDGGEYFDAVTYTGNGTDARVITTSLNEVGLAWVKIRSGADDHRLANIVTGGNRHLKSNNTDAESTGGTVIQAFSGSTFTVGTDTSVNGNGSTYVAWTWAANGAGSTNTAGTITSTVSVNTTSGFSIVTYTGTGSAASVGHGLGVTPSMIISKNRSAAENWIVHHISATAANQYMRLNTTGAVVNDSSVFSSLPTSTVFNVGSNPEANGSGNGQVAYCFAPVAGFSSMGSYVGNGSTDGPFVYTGFRPAFVMVKRFDDVNSWNIWDNKRNPYNQQNNVLYANSSSAEDTRQSDFVSNGFKLRGTSTEFNASGGTYIYAAFAENPFAYALAR